MFSDFVNKLRGRHTQVTETLEEMEDNDKEIERIRDRDRKLRKKLNAELRAIEIGIEGLARREGLKR